MRSFIVVNKKHTEMPLGFGSASHHHCHTHTTTSIPNRGQGLAQLVDHPTEMPGAILVQLRVPGAARDFSPRVNFQCRLCYGVRTALCAIACINICAHVKNTKLWQPDHCLDSREYCTYQ